MLQSPFRFHLSSESLTMYGGGTGNDLLQLHTRCPHLELSLTVWVGAASTVALTKSADDAAEFNTCTHACHWPPSLHALEIDVDGADKLVATQRLVNGLPFAVPTLQSLKLLLRSMDYDADRMVDVSSLLHQPHLTSLHANLALSPPQLAVLRQLRGLTALDLNEGVWSSETLSSLLSSGGQHQLQKLQRMLSTCAYSLYITDHGRTERHKRRKGTLRRDR
jgi:hypothetical protein